MIRPGFVTDDGMYARRVNLGEAASLALKPTTSAKVVAAVVKAIKQDSAEQFVNPLPMRPITALREVIPGKTPYLNKTFGITDFARRASERP